MSDSILEGIRRGCQIDQDCNDFDEDIIPPANAAFSKLTRLGVGPEEGFELTEVLDLWSDYCSDKMLLGFVKPYVYKKTRLSFDPPASSTILDALKKEIDELEWNIIEYLENSK